MTARDEWLSTTSGWQAAQRINSNRDRTAASRVVLALC
jgi:hypothetical protein